MLAKKVSRNIVITNLLFDSNIEYCILWAIVLAVAWESLVVLVVVIIISVIVII